MFYGEGIWTALLTEEGMAGGMVQGGTWEDICGTLLIADDEPKIRQGLKKYTGNL